MLIKTSTTNSPHVMKRLTHTKRLTYSLFFRHITTADECLRLLSSARLYQQLKISPSNGKLCKLCYIGIEKLMQKIPILEWVDFFVNDLCDWSRLKNIAQMKYPTFNQQDHIIALELVVAVLIMFYHRDNTRNVFCTRLFIFSLFFMLFSDVCVDCVDKRGYYFLYNEQEMA